MENKTILYPEPEKTLYALLTNKCNLSCPYCDIRNYEDTYNREKFLDQLKKFDGHIVLFGGEPTLYEDRLIDVFLSDPEINRKIYSITTNLMNVSDRVLSIIQLIGRAGTSWNPDRFTKNQYDIWVNNLNIFAEKMDMGLMVLVTLVDSVLDLSADEFLEIISHWNTKTVKAINFEYLVADSSDAEYFERCDKWLCKLYKKWNSEIDFINKKRVLNWYEECSQVYTLEPNGILKHGCPHHKMPTIPNECYNCNRCDICKPCQLQSYCSFPKQLYELVMKDQNK